jgi:hypothetical protein
VVVHQIHTMMTVMTREEEGKIILRPVASRGSALDFGERVPTHPLRVPFPV